MSIFVVGIVAVMILRRTLHTITIDAEKGLKTVIVDLKARTLWKCRVIFLLLFVYQFSK
jgi:hypothetical protein